MKDHYELHEGVKGNGATKWMAVAVDKDGGWIYSHDFDSKAEAKHWMAWA